MAPLAPLAAASIPWLLALADTVLADTVLADTVLDGARAAPAVGRALGVSRFAAFTGITVLLGGLFMVMMLGRDRVSETPGSSDSPDSSTMGADWPVRRVLWTGWLLLLVGSFANFGLLGADASAGALADALDTSLWSTIADTRTGSLIVARLGFVAAFVGVLVNLDQRNRLWWRIAVPVLGLLTIFTFSGSGHPSVERDAALWIGVDALHLLGIAVWLGSLLMLAVGGRAWLCDDRREFAVRRFSRMATIAVPVVVVTGVVEMGQIGGGLSTLADTTWGRLLLVKGAVAVLLVTIGGVSRWLLQSSGPSSMRRTVIAEGLLGIAVLGLTAGLVGSPPSTAASRPYTASLTEAGVIVEVSITPGRIGANEVHMVVTPAGANLRPVADLTAQMTLPSSRDIPFVPVTLTADSPNHYIGTVMLPIAGDWKLEITVAPMPDQSVLLSGTVPIPDPNP